MLFASQPGRADREPVLSQIAVPHDYYFREMHLPRVTTGPGSLAWTPDGTALVYSMQGSLWRQAVDSTIAEQLTAGSGYDFQPDVSPDGKSVVFARYDGTSIELQLLDLESGDVSALTATGAASTDPRFSPDGSRIAYVSTQSTGRFKVHVGALGDEFESVMLADDRKSEIVRYYYSEYDHELSPAWTPDGNKLLVIANPETPYGSGSLWLYDVSGAQAPELVRREETSWKAQPDIAPDGKRVAYASYLGRQWHQLWTTRIGSDAEPFPLTYGDFDTWEPRWSPDGSRIAYIVNESGNTSIRIQDFVGGRQVDLLAESRNYRVPHGSLALEISDQRDRPLPARVSLLAADGRYYAPDTAWMHADDSFDRETDRTEVHYFHTDGRAQLGLPEGPATVIVWRGPENHIEQHRVEIRKGETTTLRVMPEPLDLPRNWAKTWVSGDVHTHMNYGGTYRNTPERFARQARAEDVDVVFNLIVNKEQRVPDVAYFDPAPDPASSADVLVMHAQEYHTSHWGHQGLLGLDSHLLIPDYVAYPGTSAASLYPDNATVAKLAREQNALVGYVHPFVAPPPDPINDPALTNAFPVDAALGLVDYYEVIGFADHRASAEVWYRLMNCGLRIAAAGGTDAMANYASLRGPLGINRTYVMPRGPRNTPEQRRDEWLDALRQGRSFATNGPLLDFRVDGHWPGEELTLPAGEHKLAYSGFVRSAIPVEHVEVMWNGDVVARFETDNDGRHATISGVVPANESGWLLLRAWSGETNRLLFDMYPYATTTPVWVNIGNSVPTSTADAEYFLAWVQRLEESAARHPDYNSDDERTHILDHLSAARTRFEQCLR